MSEPDPSTDLERGGPIARRVGAVLGPVLFVVLLFAPGVPLDGPQRRVAAVTCLTAVWWITLPVPIGAASLLPAALFPLLGVMPAREAAPRYMHDLVLLFLGAFVIALGLERWGVHRRIALSVVSRVGTAPRNLVLGFMAASAFLSMWIANTATTLLMLPIALAVVSQVEGHGAHARGNFPTCLLLGIAWSSSMGGIGTPVGTAPNQVFLGQFAERFPDAPAISFGQWFLGWVPFVVLFVPIAWLLLTRLLLPVSSVPAGEVDAVRKERAALGRMSPGQRRMAAVFAVTAVLWVTRADIDLGFVRVPGWSRLFLPAAASTAEGYARHAGDVSDSTVALAMAILCFLIPSGEGRGVMLVDWRTAVRMPWDVMLLFGGGFCLAKGFQVSGLDQAVGGAIAPFLAGRSTWVLVLGTAFAVSLLTEVTSNTATTAVLLPVLAGSALEGGFHPLLVMVPATVAASAAFMMPVATPPNAVVFSSGRIPPLVMARTGFWLNLVAVLLVTIVFQLWVRRLWGIAPELPLWAD